MKLRMTFEGGSDLAQALGELPTRLSRSARREALRDAAAPMRARMSQLAPRGNPREPNLKDNIGIGDARGEDQQEVAIAVGPTIAGYYGSFQELGTSEHAAQPFARPAFDEQVGASLRILGAALWTILAGRGIFRTTSSRAPIVGGPGGGLT